MKDVLTINRAKWRTGSYSSYRTGKGETQLLNTEGCMCCLGFRCQQLGIPKKDLLDIGEPADVEWEVIPDLVTKDGTNTAFCDQAMTINDDEDITTEQREAEIIAHFAKKGTKVVF